VRPRREMAGMWLCEMNTECPITGRLAVLSSWRMRRCRRFPVPCTGEHASYRRMPCRIHPRMVFVHTFARLAACLTVRYTCFACAGCVFMMSPPNHPGRAPVL